MKITSLKYFVALFALMSCTMRNNKTDSKTETTLPDNTTEKYAQVDKLKNRANFLRKEGDIDSSIVYYKKSLTLCCMLKKQNDTAKDTIYYRHLSYISGLLGTLYDSINKRDSALFYLIKSLSWAKSSNVAPLIISAKGLIGYVYYKVGNEHTEGSEERKTSYLNGTKYLVSACRNMDSLGWTPNPAVLYDFYTKLQIMYAGIGDYNHKEFYANKIKQLKSGN